ncbi:MAG TPA: DUF1134 domain-containing protein [Allosphingosinicella sp.]|jgi:hypothetical protein
MLKRFSIAAAALAAFASAAPAAAQDAPPAQEQPPAQSEWFPAEEQANESSAADADAAVSAQTPGTAAAPAGQALPRRDIFDAAENLFGRGAEGLAGVIERILGEQGEPIAYISGEEAGGALVFGVRYGSGVMRHRVEGDRNVYWTGPSIGFDAGAQASKVFVLVYNLNDAQRLFRRYPAAEGNAYMVGGFTASYLRRGDVVLIPIRMGVGVRLGINAGYMRFSQKNRWLPF